MAEYLMTSEELVKKCNNYYARPNYYDNLTSKWMAWNTTKNAWAGDCIRCPKALIYWGWQGNRYLEHGGAVYDKAYDFTETAWIKHCNNVSMDFTSIKPGELMYMSGHCGIYLGDRQVFEVTMGWSQNGAVMSEVGTDGKRTLNGVPAVNAYWESHGEIPEIEYTKGDEEEMTYQENKMVEFFKNNTYLKKGDCSEIVGFVQSYLSWFNYYTGTIDNDYGSMTVEAVKKWQKANNITVDGEVGYESWTVIQKGQG